MGTLRQLENAKWKCPRCQGRTVKFGKSQYNGKPRRRCEECNYQYQVTIYPLL